MLRANKRVWNHFISFSFIFLSLLFLFFLAFVSFLPASSLSFPILIYLTYERRLSSEVFPVLPWERSGGGCCVTQLRELGIQNCGDTATTPSFDLNDRVDAERLRPVLPLACSLRFERLLFERFVQRSFNTLRQKFRRYLQSAPRTSTLDATNRNISPPVRLKIESAWLVRCTSGILGIFLLVTQAW